MLGTLLSRLLRWVIAGAWVRPKDKVSDRWVREHLRSEKPPEHEGPAWQWPLRGGESDER